MPALLIKDIPQKLHRRIKRAAKLHRRSMTREAIVILEEALERPVLRSLPTPVKGRSELTQKLVSRAMGAGRK